MKKGMLFTLLLCLLAQWGTAQTPKWAEKARRAVFSIVTYDKNDKILSSGNGFFVTETGVALSDYGLFKGADRAVVVTADGQKLEVTSILGANDMYDVVKFQVSEGKKLTALVPVTGSLATGTPAYLLPYSTQKSAPTTTGSVTRTDSVDGQYAYYTLALPLKDKMVSCPLMTAEGEVFGLAQKSSGQDTTTTCYAVDVRFALAQTISAFSFNSPALQGIGIRKALPDTEEQAQVLLYMASTQVSSDRYAALLEQFIEKYPESGEGYLRRATHLLQNSTETATMERAEADLEQAVTLSDSKEDIYYNYARLIYSYLLNDPQPPYKDWSYDKALQQIDQAIALQPLPVYIQLKGDILYAKQDYAAALDCYEQVNRSNLASPATYFSAVRAKQQTDAPAEETLALMDSCINLFPKPYTEAAAPYLWERAQMRVAAGHARYAMQDYDEYQRIMGSRVNDLFFYTRADAALQAKQYQRALNDLEEAISMNPKELGYRSQLAVVNLRVARNEEAVRVLDEALAIDPNFAEGYRLKGIAYIQMKKNKEACALFAKAKELGDENTDELIEKYCK